MLPEPEAAPTPTVLPAPDGGAHTSDESRSRFGAPDPSSLLLMAADFLDDVEGVRIASENRVRALGETKGLAGTPAHRRWEAHVDALRAVESAAILELKRALRLHPLGDWVKRTVGVGEKQGGRLIAAIGDPYWNGAANRPRRGPAELWAYCGLHTVPRTPSTPPPTARASAGDVPLGQTRSGTPSRGAGGNVAVRRRRGEKANWNASAKMRAYLVAESCIKQRHSPYRAVYDRARVSAAEKGWTDGHAHNHGLRLVSKELLKDLWREARDRRSSGAHTTYVPRALAEEEG